MNKSLLEKIQIVLDKYNNGKDNGYSKDFKKYTKAKWEQTVEQDCIFDEGNNSYSIQELIGICILDNNPDLFESKELEPPMMGMSF